MGGRGVQGIAGGLMLSVLAVAVAMGVNPALPAWLPGSLAWGAALLLWPRLAYAQKRTVCLLLAGGVAAGIAAALRGAPFTLNLTQNIPIIGLLAATTFLSLAGRQEPWPGPPQPAWLRLGSYHLLAGFINISALVLVAERLARRGRLSTDQATLIGQVFSTAGLWSPFFAAMAVALVFAPGAAYVPVATVGLLVALSCLVLPWRFVRRQTLPDGGDLFPCPMGAAALKLPLILALAVAGLHYWQPRWSVLAIITLLAPLLVALFLTREEGAAAARRQLAAHVVERLPAMQGELWLFLAAGVLGGGLGLFLQTLHWTLPLAAFGGAAAAVLMGAMILVAAAGIHPVVSITLLSAALQSLSPDPNLLAMMFLMGWALGVLCSPFSGIQLTLKGRFGVDTAAVVRGNVPFVRRAGLICTAALCLYSYLALGHL